MPLTLPDLLPAIELLKQENIFVMDSTRANTQDIRPLRIAILNLMPIKITTETDFIRLLSNTPLQIQIEFMKIKSHTSKNTPVEHMMMFYRDFEEMKKEKYDGLIVTGAPLEQMDYEEVTYWGELQEVFNWAHSHVTSTVYICWAAQAALYHFYGVPKYPTSEKVFGIFKHKALVPHLPIFRGFDDEFFAPHSRHSEILRKDIEKIDALTIISESEEAGVHIVTARNGREFFITGHSEYAPDTLDNEYRRDVAKGLPIKIPQNYYRDDNPDNGPVVKWRGHANLLFGNWLNYYVYQETPYNINDISE
ncbi:MAG: homoserine O-succinyltransferase [Bacteroidaceae bacterium]|nr:homoserine O-succinyltransferase [Bacteroidaceae bacterium]